MPASSAALPSFPCPLDFGKNPKQLKKWKDKLQASHLIRFLSLQKPIDINRCLWSHIYTKRVFQAGCSLAGTYIMYIIFLRNLADLDISYSVSYRHWCIGWFTVCLLCICLKYLWQVDIFWISDLKIFFFDDIIMSLRLNFQKWIWW